MRKFEYLTVRGIPFFKDQTFRLDQEGLSVILGLNLNGSRASKSGDQNTNMTGKSLFFSSIREIFFRDGVSGKAKDKIKQGEIELGITVNKDKYVILRYLKGKSEKYQITKNGQDITPTATANQQKKLGSILGHSQKAYEVIYYLDHLQPHPLRTGDTAERRKFFTSFFDLDSADTIKRLIGAERTQLRKEAAVLAELRGQLDDKKIDPAALKDLKEKQGKYQRLIQRFEKELEAMTDARDYFRFVSLHDKALKAFKASGFVENGLKFALTATKAYLTDVTDSIEATATQKEYQEEVSHWKRQVKERDDYLKQEGLDLKDMASARDKEKRLREAKTSSSEDLLNVRSQLNSLKSKLGDAQATLELKQEALSELRTSKGSKVCSECGQPVTQDHFKKELAAAKKAVETAEAQIADLNLKIRAAKEKDMAARDLAEKQARIHMKAEAAYTKFLGVPRVGDKPEAPKVDKGQVLDADGLQVAYKQKAEFEDTIANLRVLREASPEHLKKWAAGEKAAYSDKAWDEITAKVLAYSSKLQDAEYRITTIEEAVSEKAKLEKRIKELDQRVRDIEVLNVLDKAFASNAGVKQLIIRSICAALEDQVNRYAKFLFPENYIFEFDLATQFDIKATRKVGKQTITTDVRKLCGAESGLFDLLLSVSLMSFVPPSRRCNVLIMDEIDSNFGPKITRSFIEFLPKLNKIIPHIIVITPQSRNLYGPDAKYHTVVKRGSDSIIVPGRDVDTIMKSLPPLTKARTRK